MGRAPAYDEPMSIDPASPSSTIGEPVVERVHLDDHCWVDVVREIIPSAAADQLHDELATTVKWEQNKVFRYERWIDEPRLGSWQAGDNRHPVLADIETWISARYRVRFDGLALAQYRNERDSVAWHRDRELKWLDDTIIGVLTLGAKRSWMMRPMGTKRAAEDDDLRDAIELAPASGDLMVMGGRTQAAWLHAVPKAHHPVRSRISVQWRWTSRRGRPDTNPSYYAPRHFSR